MLLLWRLNEKVCMVGGGGGRADQRGKPSRRQTAEAEDSRQSGSDDNGEEFQTEGGKRERSCGVRRVRTRAPANSIHRPPPALSSLLIKSPLCRLDAAASSCVAAASRSRPPPPPPHSPRSPPPPPRAIPGIPDTSPRRVTPQLNRIKRAINLWGGGREGREGGEGGGERRVSSVDEPLKQINK